MFKIIAKAMVLLLLISVNLCYGGEINIMVKVPGGTFKMGTIKVKVFSFIISKFDITQHEWLSVMGRNPSHFNDDLNNPVEMVSWFDALAYCNKRSIKEGLIPVYSIGKNTDPSAWGAPPSGNSYVGKTWNDVRANRSAGGYRLPTEIEWMWSAMGGDPDGYSKAFAGSTGKNNIADFAWTCDNCRSVVHSGGSTHPVGTKLPNELGLYDMSGNVWQWCWDRWRERGIGVTQERVACGGSWYDRMSNAIDKTYRGFHGESAFDGPSSYAVAYCGHGIPNGQSDFIGFRVARN
jgi:formylglycine-generating enzyme required for sulfatase activity